VELSEAADADLVEILSYGTEAFGEERAEAYVESFKENSDLISMHPLAGAVHDEVRPPIRSLPHGSHRLSTTFSTMRSSSSESCTRRWMCCGIFEGSR
jgi:plasmid stabilization system protein ParE